VLLQPDFFEKDPLEFIKSKKNLNFAKLLQNNGMDEKKIRDILMDFYSFKVMLSEIDSKAGNPEWVEVRSWRKTIGKQYDKAIRSIEKLIDDETVPLSTRETVIKKDIQTLRKKRDFLTYAFLKPALKNAPVSIHQMVNFQSRALYEYLKKFNIIGTDKELYDFMAELFRNLYQGTIISEAMQRLTGDKLKKNFIDNVDKLTEGKYNELEKRIKDVIS